MPHDLDRRVSRATLLFFSMALVLLHPQFADGAHQLMTYGTSNLIIALNLMPGWLGLFLLLPLTEGLPIRWWRMTAQGLLTLCGLAQLAGWVYVLAGADPLTVLILLSILGQLLAVALLLWYVLSVPTEIRGQSARFWWIMCGLFGFTCLVFVVRIVGIELISRGLINPSGGAGLYSMDNAAYILRFLLGLAALGALLQLLLRQFALTPSDKRQ